MTKNEKVKELLKECQTVTNRVADDVRTIRRLATDLAVMVHDMQEVASAPRPTAKLYDIKAAREAKIEPPCEGK